MNPDLASPPPPHILVTGGAGFIGSHLVERLLSDGEAVIVIDDLSTGSLQNLRAVSAHPRLRVVSSKISSCAGLREIVRRSRAIYHLAAVVGVERVLESPLRALEMNVHETDLLLNLAAEHRVPILLTSSSEVYGKAEKSDLIETDDLLIGPPDHGRWAYSCAKLMNEFAALAYARERGLPAVVARLFNTVGPRQTGRFGMVLPRFIEAAKQGKPLRVFGDGTQQRCFCYVGDTVEALIRLQACAGSPGQVFNVGGREEVSILELAGRVIEALGSGSRVERVPYRDAYPPGFEDLLRRRPDLRKLAAATGFEPATSLREMILKTAAAPA